jgi:ribosome-binding factor A
MKQYKRSDRLQEQMLRDISQLLDGRLKDVAGGLLTFTRVRLSADLRMATIYYSFLGADEHRARIEAYLAKEKGRIRSKVGKGLSIRYIPEIQFKFDPSIEDSIRMQQLFEQIRHERDGQ